MSAPAWQGRAGSILLGPTEHRVARYLDSLTRHGRIRIPTRQVADRLNLERSEAYRILRRLQALGLFGISNDRGGHAGGRWIWRTAIGHDGRRLDPERRRIARARVWAAGNRTRQLALARLASIRARSRPAAQSVAAPPGVPPAAPRRFPLLDYLRRDAPQLVADWRLDP